VPLAALRAICSIRAWCTGESAASDRKLRTNSDKCTPSEEAVSPAPATPAPEPAEVRDEL